MAVKRIKPIQDTFIVRTESGASFGGDEILELGTCYRPDASGCSRILLEFMTNEVEELLGNHSLIRATLNLKYAHSENLPPVYGVDVTEIEQEWTEGTGHVNDLPGDRSGANWINSLNCHNIKELLLYLKCLYLDISVQKYKDRKKGR